MTADRSQPHKLLSLAVHELRTPVAVATGYLRMVLQFHGQPLGDDARKFLSEASHSCATLGGLLSDMSDLSNLMAGQIPLKAEAVAIFSLAAEVAAEVRAGEERGVRLEVQGADPAVRVRGDAHWLRTSLRAVVAATLRERVQPGVLHVECRRVAAGPQRRAVIAIGDEDTAGALASLAPSRWGPFDQWRGGVGFSLPLAVQVITAHRGRLGSLPGAPARAAVAVSLPVRE
ncbi:MAG: HAMP domain-containing histidine kinase [Acidobacteria bacterium]|nr:HAMP domain-containing histidine kinase [Planctomycetota bacterium]MBE3132111.1 HAMP domain-containing histidine kinase [Acidobacteriota bacterium]